MANSVSHHAVLPVAALDALAVRSDGCYIDATFGRGGHSRRLLERLGANGRLFAIDRDPEATAAAASLSDDARFTFVAGNFADIGEIAISHAIDGAVNGILFDLGVSSPQLDSPERGFSFLHNGPLDMRMDPNSGLSAAQWLKSVAERDLAQVLFRLGDERYSRRIARAIVAARVERPLETTTQLASLIASVMPRHQPGKHPATRSFQAIRIAVNDEMGALQAALDQVPGLLAKDGRLVVISFHSLEDRIVKRFMRQQARGHQPPDRMPLTAAQVSAAADASLRLIARIRPDAGEIATNLRARSAVMRVAERIG